MGQDTQPEGFERTARLKTLRRLNTRTVSHTITLTHTNTLRYDIMRRKQRQLLRTMWGRQRVLADRQQTQSPEVVYHKWTSPHYYSEHKLNQLTNR